MNKKTKKWIGYGFGIGALLCGVSGYALLSNMANDNAKEFNQTKIVVNKQSISMQQFYDNLDYSAAGWIYTDKNGKRVNVDSLCDIDYLDKKAHAFIKSINLKTLVDTFYASYDEELLARDGKKKIIYKNKNNAVFRNLPQFGEYNYDILRTREFISDNPEVQKKVDKYNNKYNCTYEHEFQHYLNAQNGLRLWNSYKIKFVECCLDEISANIAQLLAQRKNYLKNGKNFDYIDDRFAPYIDAIKSGEIAPTADKITEKEVKFIADTVFDCWMEDKYDLYEKRTNSRTIYYLQDAPFMATNDDFEKHNNIMQKIFTIEGYDFWKYIAKRENEIFDRIDPKIIADFIERRKLKYQEMTYLDKLMENKQTNGVKEYNNTLWNNRFKAKVIAAFGKDRSK